MKVILLQDVRGQGKKGELKEVSEGYARNYLLPRKMAMEANKDNLNALALKEKAKKAQEARERAEAEALALCAPEYYVIGDCVAPATIYQATSAAYFAALDIGRKV